MSIAATASKRWLGTADCRCCQNRWTQIIGADAHGCQPTCKDRTIHHARPLLARPRLALIHKCGFFGCDRRDNSDVTFSRPRPVTAWGATSRRSGFSGFRRRWQRRPAGCPLPGPPLDGAGPEGAGGGFRSPLPVERAAPGSQADRLRRARRSNRDREPHPQNTAARRTKRETPVPEADIVYVRQQHALNARRPVARGARPDKSPA